LLIEPYATNFRLGPLVFDSRRDEGVGIGGAGTDTAIWARDNFEQVAAGAKLILDQRLVDEQSPGATDRAGAFAPAQLLHPDPGASLTSAARSPRLLRFVSIGTTPRNFSLDANFKVTNRISKREGR
jgi:hypothetical protein